MTAGVKDVREVVERARRRLAEHGQGTILFLDEVHRFNKSQQDALLPAVEEGLLVLIGATTENPYFEVNAPLLVAVDACSGCEPLAPDARAHRARPGPRERAGHGGRRGARAPGRSGRRRRPGGPQRPRGGDRPGRRRGRTVTLADAEAALDARALRYERDEHYDIVSAFIKSIRGSDPDAGLYWLARMLEAGEDARFIARRLVILASEDVGMADPMGLLVADAAARAVEFVGLPEAQLNLAQAVVHLATAPKSNRVTAALGAGPGRRAGAPGRRGAHAPAQTPATTGAKKLGPRGRLRLSSRRPAGWVPQEHRPPEVAGRVYYQPSDHGFEREIAERMRATGQRQSE